MTLNRDPIMRERKVKTERTRAVLILEMASIVVAIVLGFALSTWDQARRDRQRGEAAIERILLELAANEKVVSGLAPYHLRIAVSMDSLLTANGDGSFDMNAVPGWNGIRPPTVRTASFDVAMSTGALAHVDFATVDRIAGEYELIEDLSRTIDNGMAAFLSGSLAGLSDFRRFMALLSEQSAIVSASLKEALGDLQAAGT